MLAIFIFIFQTSSTLIWNPRSVFFIIYSQSIKVWVSEESFELKDLLITNVSYRYRSILTCCTRRKTLFNDVIPLTNFLVFTSRRM
jgi:hypothetical protein